MLHVKCFHGLTGFAAYCGLLKYFFNLAIINFALLVRLSNGNIVDFTRVSKPDVKMLRLLHVVHVNMP